MKQRKGFRRVSCCTKKQWRRNKPLHTKELSRTLLQTCRCNRFQTQGQKHCLHPRCHPHSHSQILEELARLSWYHFPKAFHTTSCTSGCIHRQPRSPLFSYISLHACIAIQYFPQPDNRGRSGQRLVFLALMQRCAHSTCLPTVSVIAIYLELERMGEWASSEHSRPDRCPF